MFPTRRIITSGGDVFRDEYSLAFDGTNDSVNVGASDHFITGTNVTIACWFKASDTDSAYLISNQKGAASTNLSLGVHNNDGTGAAGYITIVVWGGSAHTYVSYDGSIDDGSWHHIVATTTSSTQHLYLDGVLVRTESNTFSNAAHGTAIMSLGSLNGADTFFGGKMSDVAIYNSVLTASQVATIYNGREPYNHKEGVASGNLVAWWRMGDGVLDNKVISGLIADQTNATTSYLLTDDFSSDPTGDWANIENNEAHDIGAYKLEATTTNTNKGCNRGSLVTEGNTYHVKFKAKSDSSSIAFTSVGNNQELNAVLNPTLTASYQNYEFYTKTDSGELFRLYIGARSVGEDLWIDDIDIKQVNGNSGIMINMTADDFTGDTP